MNNTILSRFILGGLTAVIGNLVFDALGINETTVTQYLKKVIA